MKTHYYRFIVFVSIALMVTACAGTNVAQNVPDGAETADVSSEEDTANSVVEVETDEAEATTPVTASALLPALAMERQPVSIVTEDGRTLEGYYYPAAVNPAPVIVMMHWAPGTMEDWQAIAPWLQNRGNAEERMPVLGCGGRENNFVIGPWLDEAWFPALTDETTFGLVVFNFGGCGNSEQGAGGGGLLLDAKAAVLAASTLDGVDASRISTLGASIGSDGAPDGCLLFNQTVAAGEADGRCIGAFSLSPGDYLTLDYGETVAGLQALAPAVPVTCLAAAGDGGAPATCREASGDSYSIYIYSGSDHGMALVDPAQTPMEPASDMNALQLYLEFLEMIYGVALME